MKRFSFCFILLLGIISSAASAKDFGAYWTNPGATELGWEEHEAVINHFFLFYKAEPLFLTAGQDSRVFLSAKEKEDLHGKFFHFQKEFLVKDPRLSEHWKSIVFETDGDLGTLGEAIAECAELDSSDQKMMMNILYHLWYIVPRSYFQSPDEKGEESEELLSRSLTPSQVRRIMEYYTHAAWDPALVKSLYTAAKNKYDKVGDKEEVVVLDDGIEYHFAVMGYSRILDQYAVAISWPGEWQGIGVDGDQNVLFYDNIPPPWPNRLTNQDARKLLAGWANK